MKKAKTKPIAEIKGKIVFSSEWVVFAPVDSTAPALSGTVLNTLPEEITVNGKTIRAERVTPVRNQYDFKPFFGAPPYARTHAAYVFLPLDSNAEQEVTLGMGADWYLQAWLNGESVFDTLKDGNKFSPPSINDHRVVVMLKAGKNMLVVRFMNGNSAAVLALGGPEELRRGDFISIIPPPKKLDAAGLFAKYPADPEAPIRWVPPAGFDPNKDDLGMPLMESAEHFELLRCLKSKAPLDEGGSGVYESLQHGTWNHNIGIAVFRDRLIGIWDNHALDENGPGSRVMARAGKIINDRGEVDWGGAENILELAPAPVPVRRRKIHSDRDVVKGAQAKGRFYVIGDRLFFCGHMAAIHGKTTDPDSALWSGPSGKKRLMPVEHFHFGSGPQALHAGFIHWDLGYKFYQEWGVRDDRLQPVSPIYKENEMPAELAMTPELSLPLEPLIPPYRDAPLLSEAPEDFQDLIRKGERRGFVRSPRYRPGTYRLAHDGDNGLAHYSEFKRPDGSWVAVRENQMPRVKPFYYAAEKPDAESYYPPARRSNLFGAVKPASGELPDGRVFIVGNSPNRQKMFITVSRDGKVFDGTWFLLHRQLRDFTPGAMKNEGGPGAGPQYFMPAVIGESVWLVYSISKEHVGATRIPVSELGKSER